MRSGSLNMQGMILKYSGLEPIGRTTFQLQYVLEFCPETLIEHSVEYCSHCSNLTMWSTPL